MKTAELIRFALNEDIGGGDVTSLYFVPVTLGGSAVISSREPCVVSGVEVACETFVEADVQINVLPLKKDGDLLSAGEGIIKVSGAVRSLLLGERVALNFLQRLSGVATLTRRFVDAIEGTHARILDTRKTTPGWRLLEKAAVVHGGGSNHRMGLFDRVMVKDNHLASMGDGASDMSKLANIIAKIRKESPGLPVQLEADTLEQVSLFAKLDIDFILLDNMPPAMLREAVNIVAGRCKTEASGGVGLETIRDIAESGVDFISVGALTHSARSIDIGMDYKSSW